MYMRSTKYPHSEKYPLKIMKKKNKKTNVIHTLHWYPEECEKVFNKSKSVN